MKTVRTAVQILTMFDAETPAVTVSAAASRFGLTPSASSRLLASLASSGIVQRGPDRAYRPGPLAYRLGLLYHAHNRLADRVNDGARKVIAETGMTCWVSVLSGTDSMLISRFPGPRDQGFHVNPGNLLPANASASGKALLARLPDAKLGKLLDAAKLNAWTRKSKTDAGALRADLDLIRQRGWSIIIEELFVDTISVGVAFSAPLEATSMALSMSVHTASMDEVANGVQALTAAAVEIGEMVGDSYWSSRTASDDLAAIKSDIRDYVSLSEAPEQASA